jgi:hypothetical protein
LFNLDTARSVIEKPQKLALTGEILAVRSLNATFGQFGF